MKTQNSKTGSEGGFPRKTQNPCVSSLKFFISASITKTRVFLLLCWWWWWWGKALRLGKEGWCATSGAKFHQSLTKIDFSSFPALLLFLPPHPNSSSSSYFPKTRKPVRRSFANLERSLYVCECVCAGRRRRVRSFYPRRTTTAGLIGFV